MQSPPDVVFIAVPGFLVDGVEVLIRHEFPRDEFNAADFVRWLLLMHITPRDMQAIERLRPRLGFRFRLRQWIRGRRRLMREQVQQRRRELGVRSLREMPRSLQRDSDRWR